MVKKNELQWDAKPDGDDSSDSSSIASDSSSNDSIEYQNEILGDENLEIPQTLQQPQQVQPIVQQPIVQQPQQVKSIIQQVQSLETGISNMKFPSNIILAGQTDTGKSELVKNMVYHYALKFNRIYLFSPTANLQGQNFLPREYIISDVTPQKVENIVKQQINNKIYKTLMIFDDCIGSVNFRNSNIFDKLASSGRHYNCSSIHIVQDLNKLSPCIRNNSKYLYTTLCKEHQLKTIFELSSGFSSFSEFKLFMKDSCKKFQCVRFNLSGETDIAHLVFSMKLSPKFKILVP